MKFPPVHRKFSATKTKKKIGVMNIRTKYFICGANYVVGNTILIYILALVQCYLISSFIFIESKIIDDCNLKYVLVPLSDSLDVKLLDVKLMCSKTEYLKQYTR